MSTRTDGEHERAILELRAKGLSLAKISKRIDMPASTVRAVLERHGKTGERPKSRDAEILPLLDAGHTYQQIAQQLGISTATVHAAAKRAGRPTVRQPRWTREQHQQLTELYAVGRTYEQIATEMGISDTAVYGHVKHLGLTREQARATIHGRPVCWRTGCQHPVCLAAKAEYKRAERERALVLGPVSHGLSGYARGCRCDICQTAHDTQMHERRDRTRKTAVAHREPWTEAEDEAILDTTRRIEDIAADIGRTYSAIDNRRRYLARRADPSKPARTKRPSRRRTPTQDTAEAPAPVAYPRRTATAARRFAERAAELEAWIRRHGRTPSTFAEDAAEVSLARWYGKHSSKPTTDPDRIELFGHVTELWQQTRRDRSETLAAAARIRHNATRNASRARARDAGA